MKALCMVYDVGMVCVWCMVYVWYTLEGCEVTYACVRACVRAWRITRVADARPRLGWATDDG